MPSPDPNVRFTPEDLKRRAEAAHRENRLETVHRDIRLPDDALVMRGGTLRRSDLEKSLKKSRHFMKRAGLSVAAAEVPTPADLLNLYPLPNPELSFATVGKLRARGFEFEQTGTWPHHTVWLPKDDPEDDGFWIQIFCLCFDDPVRAEELRSSVSPATDD